MHLAKKLIGAAAALALTLGAANAQVVVSSKIDTEGGVLGNIIKLVLEANGVAVTDKVQLGGTPIVREAIKAGEIDIYPEYTGNGAFFLEQEAGSDPLLWNDAAKGYAQVAKLDLAQNNVVWLTPSPANNTWAIAVRKEIADANNLKTLSDFGAFIAGGGAIKLAGSAEFFNSEAALPAFQKTYGFTLTPDQSVILSGGDTAATIAAAAQQTSGVNAAMVYGTDGGIAPSGLVVLDDDKGVQPVYNAAPIIRKDVLDANPQIADLLKPVFEALTLEELQTLNGRVQVGGEAAAAVAADWLKSKGFVS